jgi:four helix bundle protein
MNPKPYDLKERTFLFAARILKLAGMLQVTNESQIVRKQLARAGTSIGSNVEEADGCETRAEKRRLFILARREARETRYWLRIVQHLWSPGVNVESDLTEISEIVKILSSIILKLGGSS